VSTAAADFTYFTTAAADFAYLTTAAADLTHFTGLKDEQSTKI
jgi:hypothetical protein